MIQEIFLIVPIFLALITIFSHNMIHMSLLTCIKCYKPVCETENDLMSDLS